MAGIGKNRVFDCAGLSELQESAGQMLDTAAQVTGELSEEMQRLVSAAAKVPTEARYAELSEAAERLSGKLDETPYLTTKQWLTEILQKLQSEIPRYDAFFGETLNQASLSTGSLLAMLEELKGFLGKGGLSMTLPEYRKAMEDFERRFAIQEAVLKGSLTLAQTYLKGMVLTSSFSCDPVNLSTGNFYYEKEDLSIAGYIPLRFKRFYNAIGEGDSVLGEGWSTLLDMAILFGKEERLTLRGEDGKETIFCHKGEVYTDIHTGRSHIQKTADGYVYQEGYGKELFFDERGRIARIRNADGRYIFFIRDSRNERIIKAGTGYLDEERLKETGDFFQFTYNEQGKLIRVEDHTGRKVTYFHMDGRLHEVTDTEGYTICYRYAENRKLCAVRNARNIRTVRNIYDEKGRILHQRFPDKGQMHYEYRRGETVLTERNGSRIIYQQDEKLRNIRTIYHDSQEESSYDDRDLKTSYTDRNGNTTVYSYDDEGHLAGITDALGRKRSFACDKQGRLLWIQADGKKLVTNRYDENGRHVETEDAMGRKQKIIYGKSGLAEKVEGPDGSSYTFRYDKKGNLISIRDPYGAENDYEYDALNRVISTTDGNRNRMFYEYDQKDHITKVTNAEGNSRRYYYNESGKVIKVVDFDGEEMEITYNDLNRPQIIRDKEGRETELTYDVMWNVKEEFLPTGAVVHYGYDEDNRLAGYEFYETKAREKKLRSVRYQYDHNGNRTGVLAGEGNDAMEIRYAYDALNRRISYTDGEGNTTRYHYDSLGRVNSIEDAAGNIYRREYNEAGELTARISPQGFRKSYTYDEAGNLTGITDALGRITQVIYEPGGRRSKVIYPGGEEESYTYDANGNLLTKRRGNQQLTYTYDVMNRIVEKRSSAGACQTYEYDALNRIIARTDSNGNRTEYEYTRSGKLKKVTDALSGESHYTYDDGDALIQIRQGNKEDPQSPHTEYERNSIGELITVRDALSNEEHYRYDSLGRLREKEDRDGFVTRFCYQGNGELSKITYGDGKEVELFYSPLRKLREIKDSFGVTRIEQDSFGRTVKVTDPENRTIEYQYGTYGERLGMRSSDGAVTRYTYDDQLRLLTADDGQGFLSENTFAYDREGRLLERTTENGLHTIYSYNEMGKLVKMSCRDTGGILEDYRYEYDISGNKCAVTRERRGLPEESGRYEYQYDSLNRLTGVSRNGKLLREYNYDAYGNRKIFKDVQKGEETHYEYNAVNQLVREFHEETEKTYRYDKRGNLTGEWENGILQCTYEYDAANRLVHAVTENGEDAWYAYNGLGQRIEERHGEKRTRFLLDLTRPYQNLLEKEEFLPDGESRKQTYLWGGTLLGMTEERENKKSSAEFILDELGSPVRLLKEDKALEEVYGYDEFGNGWGESSQPFGYTGYRKDETTGAWFAQAREYQPQTGRFMGEDVIKGSIAVPKTLNPYGYCLGNPIIWVDQNGKQVNDSTSNYVGPDIEEVLTYDESHLHDFFESMSEEERASFLNQFDKYTKEWMKDSIIKSHDDLKETPYFSNPQVEDKNQAQLSSLDKSIQYIDIDEHEKMFEVSIQYGTGLYAEIDLDGLGIKGGAKLYQEVSNTNWGLLKNCGEVGIGARILGFGGEAGLRHKVYPWLNYQVKESGAYVETDFCNMSKENGDIYGNISVGAYVILGAQVDVKINLTDLNKWVSDRIIESLTECPIQE